MRILSIIRQAWHWFGQYTRATSLMDLFGWRDGITAAGMVAVGVAKDWPLPWIILGACAVFFLFAAGRWLWNHGGHPAPKASAAVTAAGGLPELTPIVDFLRAAERRGWRFVEPKSRVLDFLRALREDAANGAPRFYGVQVKIGTQEELSAPRIPIPSEHWREFQVDFVPCFELDASNGQIEAVARDNSGTRSYKLTHETGFVDLHVVAADGETWIGRARRRADGEARRQGVRDRAIGCGRTSVEAIDAGPGRQTK